LLIALACSPNVAKSRCAMEAVFPMKKIDIAAIRRAEEQE
jgi:hypothetical protein